jgi:alpha-glucosidase
MRPDYLQDLGVDAPWLSPFYPSPMHDFGYDVSNYVDVDPVFGTLADFDELVYEAHRRGLRVMIDYVLNHISVDHPWFVDSRSSRSSTYSDWYIWAGPKPDGTPPNNWLSVFGGPAWEFDAVRQRYYSIGSFGSRPPQLAESYRPG